MTEYIPQRPPIYASTTEALQWLGLVHPDLVLTKIPHDPYLTLRESQAEPMLRKVGFLDVGEQLRQITDAAQETGDYERVLAISTLFHLATDTSGHRVLEIVLHGRNLHHIFPPAAEGVKRTFRVSNKSLIDNDWYRNIASLRLGTTSKDEFIRQLVEEAMQYSFAIKIRIIGKVAQKAINDQTRFELQTKLQEFGELVTLFTKESQFLLHILQLNKQGKIKLSGAQLHAIRTVRRILRAEQAQIEMFKKDTKIQDLIESFFPEVE